MSNSFTEWYEKMWLRTNDANYYRAAYGKEPPKDLSQYFVE